jgi:hypothetical protein
MPECPPRQEFGRLYDEHFDPIFRYVLHRVGNVTIDLASSSTAELSADSLTFTAGDGGEALRTRILELEAEIDRLERELDRLGSD